MGKYISVDKNIMSGTPSSKGTRVPIQRIVFLLKQGYNIYGLHEEFPHIDMKILQGVMDEVSQIVIKSLHGTSLT